MRAPLFVPSRPGVCHTKHSVLHGALSRGSIAWCLQGEAELTDPQLQLLQQILNLGNHNRPETLGLWSFVAVVNAHPYLSAGTVQTKVQKRQIAPSCNYGHST